MTDGRVCAPSCAARLHEDVQRALLAGVSPTDAGLSVTEMTMTYIKKFNDKAGTSTDALKTKRFGTD